jgi:hypothetical protein
VVGERNISDENAVTLTKSGLRYVAIEGLTGEEEDALYSHLERTYGADKVDGVITPVYRIMVDDMLAMELMQKVIRFCEQNGKTVTVI